jgi:hypothetical protein
MTQADRVHSTPPINTSADNAPGGPESPANALYLPADVSPEEVFQAIGKLRGRIFPSGLKIGGVVARNIGDSPRQLGEEHSYFFDLHHPCPPLEDSPPTPDKDELSSRQTSKKSEHNSSTFILPRDLCSRTSTSSTIRTNI